MFLLVHLLSLVLLPTADTAVLTLWEHPDQGGRSLTLTGPTPFIGEELDNSISSVRADNGTWELYTEAGYSGSRAIAREGITTGAYWDDAISSARPLCAYSTDPSIARLLVYEHHEAQGESKEYLGPVPWVGYDWNDRITSVLAVAGDWEFYSDWNYEGARTVVREGDFINLSEQFFNDRLSSLRPVCETYRGANKCVLNQIKVLGEGQAPSFAGTQVIGSASGGTCYGGAGGTLTLSNVDTVEESYSLETGEENEVNWYMSLEISVTAAAGFMGSGSSVTMSASAGVGASKVVSRVETKSFGTGSEVGAGKTIHYYTPGAALLFGVVDRYELDNSQVPVRLSLSCPNGTNKTRDSTMRMRSVTYQSVWFTSLQGRFSTAACQADRDLPDCVHNVRAKFSNYWGHKHELQAAFERCFADDKGSVDKK